MFFSSCGGKKQFGIWGKGFDCLPSAGHTQEPQIKNDFSLTKVLRLPNVSAWVEWGSEKEVFLGVGGPFIFFRVFIFLFRVYRWDDSGLCVRESTLE